MRINNVKQRVQEYFFLNPTAKLRVRQIERLVEVPLPSVIRYVKELEKEGILKRSEIAGITVYSADRTSKSFLLEKKLSNIRRLYSLGLIDLFNKEFNNPAIVVFGSYAKGEDVENSDIDLYIEAQAKKMDFKELEKRLGRKIQVFMHKNIYKIGNKELANNIMNGIVLNGFVEVFA